MKWKDNVEQLCKKKKESDNEIPLIIVEEDLEKLAYMRWIVKVNYDRNQDLELESSFSGSSVSLTGIFLAISLYFLL